MKIKVLYAASECVPYIKTGGLADVIGSLPKALDPAKYDARIILPKYSCIKEELLQDLVKVKSFQAEFRGKIQKVTIYRTSLQNVPVYFMQNDQYFNCDWPYGETLEDIEKFSFFSKMVLKALPLIHFQPDILHCHDWQTGLIPVYLNDSFQGDPFYHQMKTVYTIHNLKFQGVWDIPTMMSITGLGGYYFTPDKLEFYNSGNLLKGGLVYADRITTVSETYAHEIQTAFYGEGLDGLLRAKQNHLVGIVNGIDTDYYDPAKDKDIEKHYTVQTLVRNKKVNKAALQKELGLLEAPEAFLIGIVSRLTDQKGFDLIADILPELLRLPGLQLAVLGTGDKRYEGLFKEAAEKNPGSVSANIFYSEALSHRIYASCDAFLMPSLFEPCGLSQLMALRYGTLPIVRETGGLKDTVQAYNEYTQEGTGFSFANYQSSELLGIIKYAKTVYDQDRKAWDRMAKRAMKEDFSWKSSAYEYEVVYQELYREKKAAVRYES